MATQRNQRSLTEFMNILHSHSNERSWSCQIQSQSKKKYDIYFDEQKYSCSCPDHVIRHNFCKHLLFIINYVAKERTIAKQISQFPQLWNRDIFQKICFPSNIINIPTNESCVICYEPITIYSCQCNFQCNAWFHNSCINRWLNQNNTCPHCRSQWNL